MYNFIKTGVILSLKKKKQFYMHLWIYIRYSLELFWIQKNCVINGI